MRNPDPAKAVQVLTSMVLFYGEGNRWTRGTTDDGNGKHCLVGAIELHCKHPGTMRAVVDYIGAAISPRRERKYYFPRAVMTFNDRCNGIERIFDVLVRARALAQRDAERLPEITAAAKAVGAEKEEAAAARKRQLLAELERERMVRHAAGDTRETYILCPRPPAPPAEPQRLAA
jgi:hypothetical protein